MAYHEMMEAITEAHGAIDTETCRQCLMAEYNKAKAIKKDNVLTPREVFSLASNQAVQRPSNMVSTNSEFPMHR